MSETGPDNPQDLVYPGLWPGQVAAPKQLPGYDASDRSSSALASMIAAYEEGRRADSELAQRDHERRISVGMVGGGAVARALHATTRHVVVGQRRKSQPGEPKEAISDD